MTVLRELFAVAVTVDVWHHRTAVNMVAHLRLGKERLPTLTSKDTCYLPDRECNRISIIDRATMIVIMIVIAIPISHRISPHVTSS